MQIGHMDKRSHSRAIFHPVYMKSRFPYRMIEYGMSLGQVLFGSVISGAAFLLFAVEPMVGKLILPEFGGAASVWAVSLIFFTSALTLGYGYAFLITRCSARTQRLLHVSFALLSILALTRIYAEPIETPWPLTSVLATLANTIGVPFVFLAATGPLLQRWYAERYREPYRLYALSNAASFLALCAYPFLIEPRAGLRFSFLVWAIGVAGVAALVVLLTSRVRDSSVPCASIRIVWSDLLRWIGYAALPAGMLVAVTAQLTQAVAPIPLLWVVPLGVYLASFVVAFTGRGDSNLVSIVVLAAAAAAFVLTPTETALVPLQILAYVAVLAATGVRCHARIYATRPATQELPLFYIVLSIGGMLGTILVALVAPLIFSEYWEFPVVVAVAAWAALWCISYRSAWDERVREIRILASLGVLVALAAFVGGDRLSAVAVGSVRHERNFYGVTTVVRTQEATALVHGRTLHGLEVNGATSTLPTTYYTPLSGIGRAMSFVRARQGAMRVATVGLGTGTLAAYCRTGDTFVFYEIDPRIVRIAKDDFSYLERCADTEVRLGDARLTLSDEATDAGRDSFDIVAIDAFNSDAIPLHLLTREALALYAGRLADGGMITFHISNRYLDLAPSLIRLAADGGLASMVIRDDGSRGVLGVPTTWVLMSRDAQVFKAAEFAGSDSLPPPSAKLVWTDDYTSVWSAVKLPLMSEASI